MNGAAGLTGTAPRGAACLAGAAALSAVLLLAVPARAQALRDPALVLETVASMGPISPTTLAPLGPDEWLLLERFTGRVRHLVDGVLQPGFALDVAVNTDTERGMLGIAVNSESPPDVFLYFTEGEDPGGTGADGGAPLGNRIYRYTWSPGTGSLESPALLLELPGDGGHSGGALLLGPAGETAGPGDGAVLYAVIGDVGRQGQLQNVAAGPEPDSTSVILRLLQDGTPAPGNPFAPYCGVTTTQGCAGGCPGGESCVSQVERYLAYGIRNSFGLALDPLSGALWQTENGNVGKDEVNRVEPGWNSGWRLIIGADANDPQDPGDLWPMPGGASFYSDPEFSWEMSVAPTALVFTAGSLLGPSYDDRVVLGTAAFASSESRGHLYALPLDATRSGFDLGGLAGLADAVADTSEERDLLLFGEGFDTVTDLEIGPDGALYILSHTQGTLYRATRDGSRVPLLPAGGALLLAGLALAAARRARRRALATALLLPLLLLPPAGAARATGTDEDGDGIPNAADNCTFTPNPLQEDDGGVLSALADGVGNACQCGDVDDDGDVDGDDAGLLRDLVLGVGPAPTPAGAAKCRVHQAGDCDLIGSAAIERVLAGETLLELCEPALPPMGYAGREPYAGDGHLHAALAQHWQLMADPAHDPDDPLQSCAHSYRLPADVYDLCRANGLDFCVIAHHSNQIQNPGGTFWWTDPANDGGWSNPWPFNELVPTDPAGFPLPGGGHTLSELEYLQAIADDRNEDGAFAAFYGIEFTAGAPNKPTTSCPEPGPGVPACGGHKVAICPSSGITQQCAHNPGNCLTEADFYQFLLDNGCLGIAAHPCGGIAQDFSAPTPEGGGFDNGVMVGYEMRHACEFNGANHPWPDGPQIFNYNYALGNHGLKLGVMYGSDSHNRPGSSWAAQGCDILSAEPGTTARVMCWADALTRASLADAISDKRCYYVGAAIKPRVRFAVEWRPMGSTVAVGELLRPDGVRVFLDADADPAQPGVPFAEFDVIHNGVVVLADQPCEGGVRCDFNYPILDPDPTGYWYVRIRDGANKQVITTPVWVD